MVIRLKEKVHSFLYFAGGDRMDFRKERRTASKRMAHKVYHTQSKMQGLILSLRRSQIILSSKVIFCKSRVRHRPCPVCLPIVAICFYGIGIRIHRQSV